jgi:FHS family L-fucose permease-like MFS transporter
MKLLVLLSAFIPVCLLGGAKVVTYEEFGAKGDGRTDDRSAIVRAHAAANERGARVRAKDGATYYLIAIIAFIACRWIATFAMKYFDPAGLMAIFAAAAVACSLGVMYIPTSVLFSVGGLPFSINVICLIAMSGCMSLMFPTIYGIALGGIDPKAHKLGAAGLIMAIVGGALLTPWMASIIGDADGFWTKLVPMFSSEWDTNLKLSHMSLRASFIVPVICFAVVFAYALAFRAKKGK